MAGREETAAGQCRTICKQLATNLNLNHDHDMKALEFYSGIGTRRGVLTCNSLKQSQGAFIWRYLAATAQPSSPTHSTGTKLPARCTLRILDLVSRGRCSIFALLRPCLILPQLDITTLTASYLAALEASVWLLSPACQPYTVLNPSAKAELDPRARSFLHLVQTVLPELARNNSHPSHLFIENVAGFEVSIYEPDERPIYSLKL
jgi:hypothetical protein